MGRASKRASKIREASEFSTSRLQAELGLPKTGTGVTFSWSLADIFNARDAQMRGYFILPARMAESMRTDDALFVAYCNRLAPQRCVRVTMVPASEKGKAVSVAAEAEALFGENGVGIRPGTLADIHGCLVNHGVAFGVNTMIPRDDGSRIDIEHKFWPIEFIRWDHFHRRYMARVNPDTVQPGDMVVQDPAYGFAGAYEVPITHGDGRWTIYTDHEVEPFKQEAAILPASAVWARHAFAIRDWSKGSVAHGNAKFVGEMPAGVALQNGNALTPEATAMVALLRDLASSDSPVGIRPAGSKTDFITNTSTAWQVWAELVGNGEKAAARIYLGTDGTLGSQGGAPGVDVTALFGVAITKVRGDLGCIQRCFAQGVIEPWAALNFGDSSLVPERCYMLPDEDADAVRASAATRRASFFTAIESARNNGFAVTQDYVDATAEAFGVPAPTLTAANELGPQSSLTTKDVAGTVITVNEARASVGLGPLLLQPVGDEPGAIDPHGFLTIGEFNAATIAKTDVAGSTGGAPASATDPAP